MIDDISVFLPIRKGSERVKNKNLRKFAGFDSGLLELKLKQLLDSEYISKIYLSTDYDLDELQLDSLKSLKIQYIERPKQLSESTTNLTDLVKYVPSIVKGENILWTHVTSPFLTGKKYDEIILSYYEKVLDGKYDSLMTVKEYKDFLWDPFKNAIINKKNSKLKWPRTQDLDNLYEVTSGAFLAPKNVYNQFNDRVGKKIYPYKTDKIVSFDVDDEDDFLIAEHIYESKYTQ